MSDQPQVCSFCVMDTSDPGIIFDENGRCNRCLKATDLGKQIWFPNAEGRTKLDAIIQQIMLDGKKHEYDCIIGLSGGIDSAYLAYRLRKDYPKLRPLAIHVDGGWNSEVSVKNIEMLVKKLDIDLHTEVIDWEEMQDLQLSFIKASVANQDIPQDHAFFAALYNLTNKMNIKYFLSGGNYASECILPPEWGHPANDLRHLKAVQNEFGTVKLKTFPTTSFWKWYFYYNYFKGFKVVRPLNFLSYIKAEAKAELTEVLDWKDYGEKHHESRFTKFFQTYYLPMKFGWDKRKAHFSSLIVSGQMTRDEALGLLKIKPYNENTIDDEMEYVGKKLGMSLTDFKSLYEQAPKKHTDYKTNNQLYAFKDKMKHLIK